MEPAMAQVDSHPYEYMGRCRLDLLRNFRYRGRIRQAVASHIQRENQYDPCLPSVNIKLRSFAPSMKVNVFRDTRCDLYVPMALQ